MEYHCVNAAPGKAGSEADVLLLRSAIGKSEPNRRQSQSENIQKEQSTMAMAVTAHGESRENVDKVSALRY